MAKGLRDIGSGCARIRPENSGGRRIDFLGYVFNGCSMRIRKTIKTRFARRYDRATKIGDNERKEKLRASFKGWCKWGDGRYLYNKLTGDKMGFTKLGIKAHENIDREGKRIFNEKRVPIADLVGCSITIIDFEDDIHTRETDGKNIKCVVLYEDEAGQKAKFVTSSYDIRDVLLQAREKEKGGEAVFPQSGCIIGRRRVGRYDQYYFEQ